MEPKGCMHVCAWNDSKSGISGLGCLAPQGSSLQRQLRIAGHALTSYREFEMRAGE